MPIDRIPISRGTEYRKSQKYTNFQQTYERGRHRTSEETGLGIYAPRFKDNTHLHHGGNASREENGYSQAEGHCGYLVDMAILHDCEEIECVRDADATGPLQSPEVDREGESFRWNTLCISDPQH